MKSLEHFAGVEKEGETSFHSCIRRTYNIECGHRLEAHEGKCKNDHGHNYVIELVLCGKTNPKTNMVVDVFEIDVIFKTEIESWLDHKNLNEVLDEPNPTMEILAKIIFEKLKPNMTILRSVIVHENTRSKAFYPTGKA